MGHVITVAPLLSKLIPMLASDSTGEIVATVCAIRKTLSAAGLDLHDLAVAIQPPAVHGHSNRPASQVDLARRILGNDGGQINRRERDFVADIIADAALGVEATDRQMRWLRAISASLKRRA